MRRRNTETAHEVADNLFLELGITDLQGLLKEGENIACGIECYQLSHGEIFSLDVNREEIDRYNFCKSLEAPYYVIGLTRIMEVSARDGLSYSNEIYLFSNTQQIQTEISRLITI